MDITDLLAFSVQQSASDLHLSVGLPPMIRVDGDVRRVNVPAQDHAEVQALVYDIMNDRQRKDYEEFLETDFSFEVPVSRAFASMPLIRIAARARCSERFPPRCFQWKP
jgi:twitching motility protein PilT